MFAGHYRYPGHVSNGFCGSVDPAIMSRISSRNFASNLDSKLGSSAILEVVPLQCSAPHWRPTNVPAKNPARSASTTRTNQGDIGMADP